MSKKIMKIDKERLLTLAVEENEEEKKVSSRLRHNRELFKTSMKIAMKIKRALREKGMNQTQLARRLEIDPAVLSRLLSGKANLELKTLIKFEKELGITIIDRSISPYSQPRLKFNYTDIFYYDTQVTQHKEDDNRIGFLRTLEYYNDCSSKRKFLMAETDITMVNEPFERYS